MNFSVSVFLGTLCSILAVILPLSSLKRSSKRSRPRRKTWWLIAHIFFVVLYFSGLLGTLLLSLSTAFIDRSGLIMRHTSSFSFSTGSSSFPGLSAA